MISTPPSPFFWCTYGSRLASTITFSPRSSWRRVSLSRWDVQAWPSWSRSRSISLRTSERIGWNSLRSLPPRRMRCSSELQWRHDTREATSVTSEARIESTAKAASRNQRAVAWRGATKDRSCAMST
jgi:hypothetical protein